MPKSGVIIVIDDDIDDKDLLEIIVRDLNYSNPIRWFKNTGDAWEYLMTTDELIFIIFCDVNMPRQNGLDFKKEVDNNPKLRRKSIPFIFFSTSIDQKSVDKAYTEMTVQGFFQKSSSYAQIKDNVKLIFEYWMACTHPNTQ